VFGARRTGYEVEAKESWTPDKVGGDDWG